MIKSKYILIISPEPWDGHFVSKHHYAVTLASQEHKVYFLSPPNNNLKDIKISATKYKNLWNISAPQVAKGLKYYPKKLRNFIENKWLEKLESIIGQRFTTIWLFENSRFFDMNFAEDRLKIYHQVDSNQNFHIKEASSSADICFCTTDFIKRDLIPFNKKVYKIHHGVSKVERLSLSNEQNKNFMINNINVVYVGNLDISFLDIDILMSLVAHFPKITFHFVGKYNKEEKLFKSCSNFSNIVWWGKVESHLIPSILSQCDVQLLLYKADNQLEKEQLASPHKMMEYLASGKTIVSTYTDEYKDKRHLLEMVDDSNNYMQKFTDVVKNLDFYNSKDRQKERISFAEEHSYEKQLEKIKALLAQNNLKGL